MKKPKVLVDHAPGDTAVYIRKPDGRYIGVYVGNCYRNGFLINENLSPDVPRIFGKKVWKA